MLCLNQKDWLPETNYGRVIGHLLPVHSAMTSPRNNALELASQATSSRCCILMSSDIHTSKHYKLN